MELGPVRWGSHSVCGKTSLCASAHDVVGDVGKQEVLQIFSTLSCSGKLVARSQRVWVPQLGKMMSIVSEMLGVKQAPANRL